MTIGNNKFVKKASKNARQWMNEKYLNVDNGTDDCNDLSLIALGSGSGGGRVISVVWRTRKEIWKHFYIKTTKLLILI